MNNHIFAIFGGFIGLLFTGVFLWDGTGNKVLYMAGGISAGVFLGYLVFGLLIGAKAEGFALIRKMQKVNPVRGKSFSELTYTLGTPTQSQKVTITDRNDEQGFYHTWIEGKYEVQLLFGADGICIGVSKEVQNGKRLH